MMQGLYVVIKSFDTDAKACGKSSRIITTLTLLGGITVTIREMTLEMDRNNSQRKLM